MSPGASWASKVKAIRDDVVVQDGTGETVAVADTGIDDTHPDFAGRIATKIARGRLNDASDPNGHGTHVAGSVLGDGSASNGQYQGIAPKAKLIFQSLLDSKGGLGGGLPLDLNDLFDEAYVGGARIHNNSWGARIRHRCTTSIAKRSMSLFESILTCSS